MRCIIRALFQSYEDSSNGEDDIHSWNSPRSSRQSDELFEAEGERNVYFI